MIMMEDGNDVVYTVDRYKLQVRFYLVPSPVCVEGRQGRCTLLTHDPLAHCCSSLWAVRSYPRAHWQLAGG